MPIAPPNVTLLSSLLGLRRPLNAIDVGRVSPGRRSKISMVLDPFESTVSGSGTRKHLLFVVAPAKEVMGGILKET